MENGIAVGIAISQKTYDALIKTDITGTFKLIYVAYDENGKMLDWSVSDIALSGETVKSAKPEDLLVEGAERICVMVWADIADTFKPVMEAGNLSK